jgi:superfamily II helicase
MSKNFNLTNKAINKAAALLIKLDKEDPSRVLNFFEELQTNEVIKDFVGELKKQGMLGDNSDSRIEKTLSRLSQHAIERAMEEGTEVDLTSFKIYLKYNFEAYLPRIHLWNDTAVTLLAIASRIERFEDKDLANAASDIICSIVQEVNIVYRLNGRTSIEVSEDMAAFLTSLFNNLLHVQKELPEFEDFLLNARSFISL